MAEEADDKRQGGERAKSPSASAPAFEPQPAAQAASVSSRPHADPKVLEVLVCPLTKTRLEYDAERQELISRAAGLAYPIRDGVMILLEDEARQL